MMDTKMDRKGAMTCAIDGSQCWNCSWMMFDKVENSRGWLLCPCVPMMSGNICQGSTLEQPLRDPSNATQQSQVSLSLV